MPRTLKVYSQVEPQMAEHTLAKSNQFTLDLAGLHLTDDQLAQVRQEAVKAAMTAAARLVPRTIADDFGTFSTFSTFGTFSSGVALPAELPGVAELPNAARTLVNKVLVPGTSPT